MAIKYPKKFMSKLPAGWDGEFEWDFLETAFGAKGMPMDFDAVVERYVNFLLFETKSLGKAVPKGQLITFDALIKTGYWTIFFLWMDSKNRPVKMETWHHNGTVTDVKNTDMYTVWVRAKAWYKWASKRGQVNQPTRISPRDRLGF
jgi:hypothetical protein